LARTLHSEYIGNRRDTAKAEEAIQEYKKALAVNKNDQASYKAIASLLENLQKNDEWLTWVTERSRNDQILPQHRAEALISLAAKKNGCANDITDTEKTKKTITKDGKPAFQFVKPENPEDLNTLRACVDEGNALIDQALALEPDQVKNARSVTPTSLSDEQLRETYDTLRVFESGRSYKASLLIQAGRLAEMEGRTADMEKFKTDSESAKERYRELSEVVKNLQAEIDARAAAAQEAANANANSNANSNAAP
jgi:tetratricopeptide (TPR) repeat protein